MEIKGREVKTIGPSATIATVAQRLRLERIGALVALEDDKIIGMISERDVVHAFAADRQRSAELEVANVMTRQVISCLPDDGLTRVLALIARHRVRHVPLVRAGEHLGLISIGDVAKHRLDELEMEAAVPRDSYFAGH